MGSSAGHTGARAATIARWIFLIVVLTVLPLACYGFLASFFVAEAYAAVFDRAGYVVAAICGVAVVSVAAFKDPATGQRPPFIYFAIFAPVMAWAGYASIVHGSPAALSLVADTRPGSAEFEIKDARVHHRRCRNGIKVASSDYRGGELCGLKPEFRQSLRRGDRIELFGTLSRFGIRYDRLRQLQ